VRARTACGAGRVRTHASSDPACTARPPTRCGSATATCTRGCCWSSCAPAGWPSRSCAHRRTGPCARSRPGRSRRTSAGAAGPALTRRLHAAACWGGAWLVLSGSCLAARVLHPPRASVALQALAGQPGLLSGPDFAFARGPSSDSPHPFTRRRSPQRPGAAAGRGASLQGGAASPANPPASVGAGRARVAGAGKTGAACGPSGCGGRAGGAEVQRAGASPPGADARLDGAARSPGRRAGETDRAGAAAHGGAASPTSAGCRGRSDRDSAGGGAAPGAAGCAGVATQLQAALGACQQRALDLRLRLAAAEVRRAATLQPPRSSPCSPRPAPCGASDCRGAGRRTTGAAESAKQAPAWKQKFNGSPRPA